MDLLRQDTADIRSQEGQGYRSMPRHRKRGLRRFIGPKRLIVLTIIGAFVGAGWYLRTQGLFDAAVLRGATAEHQVAAPIIFILFYGLAILSALPTLPLNLAAGLFWGPIAGGVISTTGATLGAIVAFTAARMAFGRPLAARFDSALITEMQRQFAAKGWWFVAFARLNPIFPNGPLNYILGLTSIAGWAYGCVTFVFLLPPSIAVAYIGERVGTFVGEDASSALKTTMAASGAVTVLVILIFAARLLLHLRFGSAGTLSRAD